jgi:hypothetical protein
MHADYLVIDDSSARETVERVTKGLPKLDAKTTATFVVKAIYPVNASTLMVSSENKEVLRVLDFVSKQETNYLERLLASVNVVPKEEVVRLRRESTILKQA